MTLIMCDSDCIYQADGYCKLNGYSLIVNSTQNDCVNFIPKNSNKQNIEKNYLKPKN